MAHLWKFFRAGGFEQVLLSTGADIAALPELDQKLWMALGCPANGVEFDKRTLSMLDLDQDGRIRVTEIISAIRWLQQCLKSLDVLIPRDAQLKLDEINGETPEGKRVLASAKRILHNLDKPETSIVTLEDVSDLGRILSHTRLNGDGVIPPDAADPVVATLINEIMATIGTDTDRTGKAGVSQALVEAFFSEVRAHAEWLTATERDPTILFLGDKSQAAYESFTAVHDKVRDYFTRVQLAAYEPRATERMASSDEALTTIGQHLLAPSDDDIARLPLAKIEAGRALPLDIGLNPAWSGRVQRFAQAVVEPLLGKRTTLTAEDFATVISKVGAYEAWQLQRAGAKVASLGSHRVHEINDGSLRLALEKLITEDKSLEPEIADITQVEKLVRLKRDFFHLLNNFVAFTDFYQRRGKAIFQAGTLYLDQRSCDLVVRVEDIDKHAQFAGRSCMYLAYCELVRRGTNTKMNVVAAFTNGGARNLVVGRNGVFYDRDGKDWDATIVKIVDNPISLREAFFAPYRKAVSLVEEQIERMASSREKAQQQAMAEHLAAAPGAVEAAKPPSTFDVAKFAGIFAAIGLAIGAITGALSALFAAFIKLQWWQMPLAIVGLVIVISGPSILIAFLKLRRRNLGPLLDANGWAVNAEAKVNIPLGQVLTELPELPKGAKHDRYDPFADKKPFRKWALLGIMVGLLAYAAWQRGWVHGLLGIHRSENAPTPIGKPTATPMPPPATAPLSAEKAIEAQKPLAEPINAPAQAPSATPATK